MQIKNYNRGYQPWADCVIHGTIYVSKLEAEQILYQYYDNPYTSIQADRFALGVTATNKLAGHLPKYKDQNYQFIVI